MDVHLSEPVTKAGPSRFKTKPPPHASTPPIYRDHKGGQFLWESHGETYKRNLVMVSLGGVGEPYREPPSGDGIKYLRRYAAEIGVSLKTFLRRIAASQRANE